MMIQIKIKKDRNCAMKIISTIIKLKWKINNSSKIRIKVDMEPNKEWFIIMVEGIIIEILQKWWHTREIISPMINLWAIHIKILRKMPKIAQFSMMWKNRWARWCGDNVRWRLLSGVSLFTESGEMQEG